MRDFQMWLGILVITVVLSACGDDNDQRAGRAGESGAVPAEFEPTMNEEERELLRSDFRRLGELEINGESTRFFREIFGGNGTDDVLSYTDERINYFLPALTNIYRRIRVNGQAVDLGLVQIADDPGIGAANDGVELWLLSELAKPDRLQFQFGDELLDVNSSRVGIIQTGRGYDDQPPLSRIGIQIHEARHSDCTGGITRAEIEQLFTQGGEGGKSCGHLHTTCPEGHPLAGLAACDALPWGSYAVQMVFHAGVAGNCANCTEEEIQVAQAEAIDAASRILVLDEMLAGRLGPPNMSSSGVVGTSE